ncbi:MAG: flippase-like domain-containing protein [Anaerolineae bacterium]|nr:flippase-like domain-containing protein [Anaerolineae bacterium]
MMKRWQFWLGVAISAVFLFFALRGVDWAATWQAVQTAQVGYLALAWVCLLASYLSRAMRWRSVLLPLKLVSLWTSWRVFMVGLVSNNVLPARAGELVRAYVLGQSERVDTAAVLGTVAVERVFDVLTVLLLLSLGMTSGALGGLGGEYGLWLGAAMVGGLAAGVLVIALWGDRLTGVAARLVGRFSPAWGEKIAGLGEAFVQGVRAVGSVKRAAIVVGWTWISWGLFLLYAYWVLCAYHLTVNAAGVAFLMGFAGLAVAIPSAPGSVGTMEYAYMLGLALLGVGMEETRIGFALTYHVLEWVTTLALGLFCLGQLGLSLRQVSAMANPARRGADLP